MLGVPEIKKNVTISRLENSICNHSEIVECKILKLRDLEVQKSDIQRLNWNLRFNQKLQSLK